MRRSIKLGDRAILDLIEINRLFQRSNPTVARRFRVAVDRTFKQIAARPGIGEPFDTPETDMAGVRRCLVSSKFRSYLIYYHPTDETINILRVIHGAREPYDLIDVDDLD